MIKTVWTKQCVVLSLGIIFFCPLGKKLSALSPNQLEKNEKATTAPPQPTYEQDGEGIYPDDDPIVEGPNIPPFGGVSALGRLRVSSFFLLQNEGHFSLSPKVSWEPLLVVDPTFALKASVGFSVIKNNHTIGSNMVFIEDLEGFFAIFVDDGIIELGGGVQNWGNGSSIFPVLTAALAWPFPVTSFYVDHIYLAYSNIFSTTIHTGAFQLGIGIAF